ncbi:glycosyltransferase family 4 protein [Algoriphagus marinus]|uniref:glycosyltransferase family 4 protein n=1 Tax=Algoriphagus marinus TaxID=1925762 RepID=UPI00094BB51E|nr:glycosyltransferase family 4 protein [Algoriphagus marinus]
MKILFIDTEPIRRGAQIFVSELSLFLGQNGEDCKVIYLYQKADRADKGISLSEASKILDGDKDDFSEKFPGLNSALVKRLLLEIKEFSPDVILANGSRTLKYAAAARQFYSGKCTWIARWIDDASFWNPGTASKFVYRKLIMSQFDATIGVSQASLNSMIRHYDFKKPSQVIHRAFDLEKFKGAPSREAARRDLGIGKTDEVLLFLGNLTAQKRPDRFLEIIQKLIQTRPQLKALVVGDGDLGVSIKSPISNLQSQIFFFGYQQDVSPYLAAADLLILTSDTEGLPGVVLEAGYFSVPTVATEVGGIRECLIDGESGILIPDRSIEEFVREIDFLLSDSSRLQLMGKKAKDMVLENFRMEEVARKYLSFFRGLK